MVAGDDNVRVSPECGAQTQPQNQEEGPSATQQADQSQAELWAELRDLIARAKSGDRTAVPRLREFLDRNPYLWQRPGDVGLQAQAAWVNLISGKNLHMKACTARRVNQLKQQLAGDAPPSAMETILIERIISAWLRINYIEAHEGQRVETSLRWAQFEMQRQAQADRQLRAAIDALETYRKASRPITVEIHQPAVQPRPEPVVPGPINGDEPRVGGSRNPAGGSVNGSNQPINGRNRFNGSGVDSILTGATVVNGHKG